MQCTGLFYSIFIFHLFFAFARTQLNIIKVGNGQAQQKTAITSVPTSIEEVQNSRFMNEITFRVDWIQRQQWL